jgi:hypothetical protein
MKYTLAIHKKRLRKMLKRKEPCSCCPAAKRYGVMAFCHAMWGGISEVEHICGICREFIGLKAPHPLYNLEKCPCYVLGQTEAIKRTLIALEE